MGRSLHARWSSEWDCGQWGVGTLKVAWGEGRLAQPRFSSSQLDWLQAAAVVAVAFPRMWNLRACRGAYSSLAKSLPQHLRPPDRFSRRGRQSYLRKRGHPAQPANPKSLDVLGD